MAALHAATFATPRPWSAQEFSAQLADPLCFAICESHGFLIGRAVADEAEILTLAVDPTQQRRGTGLRLVQRFMDVAKARSASSAFLEVAADNFAAISLYEKAGFAAVGRRKAYYSRPGAMPIDALVLRRSLTLGQIRPVI